MVAPLRFLRRWRPNVCEALKVNRSEIPKHMLVNGFAVKAEKIDTEETFL